MGKRLLIVGNGNHQFIFNYVKWLRKTGGFETIDILTDRMIDAENSHLYDKIFSINRTGKFYKFLSKFKGVRRAYRFYLYRRLITQLPYYDFYHFHFLNVDNTYLASLFNPEKTILTIWGSDFYRSKASHKDNLRKVCNQVKTVTCTNSITCQEIKKEFGMKKPISVCRFGLSPLESLLHCNMTKTEAKRKLGWDENKIAITVGYNMNPGQQHLEVFSALSKLGRFSDQIEIIVPITYGGNSNYERKVRLELNKLSFPVHVYDKFLTDSEIAELRIASDIMIQVQTSDQFSGSMQEYMFARNIVITGKWLPYYTLKLSGLRFIEIDEISELSEVLPYVFVNLEKINTETKDNPEAILELSSWSSNILSWLELYSYD